MTQTYTPYVLLTGPQCIPVCSAATMSTPAHVPVTAWTYPGPCGAPGVQLIPCYDASSFANHHISTTRQFYGRTNAVGQMPTPSLGSVLVPIAGSVYQPHHVLPSSMVAPLSMFSSQQQGPSSQTVYQQVSHTVYQSSPLINRAQV